MSEELKLDRYEVTEGGGTFKCPGGEMVYYSDVKSFIADNNAALRAELATFKAGQGEAVAYAYEYGKDNGDGSFSVTITRGQIPSYLTPVKDWPVKPLYLSPPASADAVSVPRELTERIVEHLEYDAIGSPSEAIAGDLAKELRAILAQSESMGVKS